MIIETERLVLRPFEEADRAPFAAMNADAETMRFFPAPLTAEQSDEMLARWERNLRDDGFSLLAAELEATGEFIGTIGLARLVPDLRLAIRGNTDVEIGWRLRKEYWGQGLAPEGADACLMYAWQKLELTEVVALTYRGNTPSRRVMEKIGMTRDMDGDFEHPRLEPGSPVRSHVLYRIARPATDV